MGMKDSWADFSIHSNKDRAPEGEEICLSCSVNCQHLKYNFYLIQ